jgi:hypothetical protein
MQVMDNQSLTKTAKKTSDKLINIRGKKIPSQHPASGISMTPPSTKAAELGLGRTRCCIILAPELGVRTSPTNGQGKDIENLTNESEPGLADGYVCL